MGKKKTVKKTKELSVAIAESSTPTDVEEGQQQTPRKRGRPRKIVIEKIEEQVEEEQETAHDVITEGELKKSKTREEEGGSIKKASWEQKEETQSSLEKEEETEVGEVRKQPPRSRARRKSKPRKSR